MSLGSPSRAAVTADGPSVRDASERDAEACALIYAPYVTDSAIAFEIEPPTPAEMGERIAAAQRTHAWVGLEDQGRVVGYAYGGPDKEQPRTAGQARSASTSSATGQGPAAARALHDALLGQLAARGFRTAVAGMTLPKAASVGLHPAISFRTVGTYRAIGCRNATWRDIAWTQRAIGIGDDPPAKVR